jgi:hypothetical protein
LGFDLNSYDEHGVELLERGKVDVDVRSWSGRHDLHELIHPDQLNVESLLEERRHFSSLLEEVNLARTNKSMDG